MRCSNEIRILEAKLSTLEEAHNLQQLEYTNEIGTLERKLSSLEEANNELQTMLTSAISNHEGCTDEIRALEAKLLSHQEENKELQSLLTARETSISKYEEQCNESRSLIGNLTKDQRTLETQLEMYNQHNQALTETINSQEAEITNLKYLIDAKSRELENEMRIKSQISFSLNAELSEKARLIKELEIKHENDLTELKMLQSKVEEFENLVKSVRNELQKLYKELEREKNINDKLVIKNKKLERNFKGEKKLIELEQTLRDYEVKLLDYDVLKRRVVDLNEIEEEHKLCPLTKDTINMLSTVKVFAFYTLWVR